MANLAEIRRHMKLSDRPEICAPSSPVRNGFASYLDCQSLEAAVAFPRKHEPVGLP